MQLSVRSRRQRPAHASNARAYLSVRSNPIDRQFNYGSLIPDHARGQTTVGRRNKELNATENRLSGSDNALGDVAHSWKSINYR